MIYQATAIQFAKMLKNLDAILVKAVPYAEAKKFEYSVFLSSRLAPDQLPLIRQIQIATDSAKICVSKLTGKEAPSHDDKETTLEELRQRIAQTITYLESITEKDFAGALEKPVTTPRWEGKWLTGFEYAMEHSIPNVYFHVTTAYQILRHNGVDVGKKDYLGALPYKQPKN